MLKRIFVIMFSGLLLSAWLILPTTHAQTGPESKETMKVRADVSKLGTGKDARVEVKLRDNTHLKGYINTADADSFTLMETKTGASHTVAYADVLQLKKAGGGISTRTWVIIGAAVAAAVVVGIIVKPAVCDGGAQTRFPC